MEMTTVKSVAIFAIIVGCFAAIYPRMFHPLLFGNSQSEQDNLSKQLPPHLRQPRPDDPPRPNMKSSSHMPHPGMRAMGEMRKQAADTKGSGRGGGIMSMVLPLYAVGIVVYMVYTLVKVFSKKDPKTNDKQKSQNAEKNIATDLFLAGKKGQKELQQLLLKAEKDDINEDELVTLKRRLMETELQMSRILKAMEMKANAKDDSSGGDAKPAADDGGDVDDVPNGDVPVENLSHNHNNETDEDEEEVVENVVQPRANGDVNGAVLINHEPAEAADDDDDGSSSSGRLHSQSSSSENDGGVEEELEEEDLDESGGDEPAGIETDEDGEDSDEAMNNSHQIISSSDLRRRNKPGNILPKIPVN